MTEREEEEVRLRKLLKSLSNQESQKKKSLKRIMKKTKMRLRVLERITVLTMAGGESIPIDERSARSKSDNELKDIVTDDIDIDEDGMNEPE